MTNITVEFTYDLPDDQYHQTDILRKTGRLTYVGPAVKYLQINAETNKLTGHTIGADEFEDYNNEEDGFYAVEVDCNANPLLCAIVDSANHVTGTVTLVEEIPGDCADYSRDDPSRPDHTYELREIEYNSSTGQFIKPFPWKQPYVTWDMQISFRNSLLTNADRTLSEDLPSALYNTVAEYKQYLRDLPVMFGAAWDVVFTNAGTGFSVGDRLLVSDSVFKNNTAVNDIVIKVDAVDENGAITEFSKQSKVYAHSYHPAAGTYNDVYHTTNSRNGTGSTIKLTKVKTVDPWKVNIKNNPLT